MSGFGYWTLWMNTSCKTSPVKISQEMAELISKFKGYHRHFTGNLAKKGEKGEF